MINLRKRASSIMLMAGAALSIAYVQAASQKKAQKKQARSTTPIKAHLPAPQEYKEPLQKKLSQQPTPLTDSVAKSTKEAPDTIHSVIKQEHNKANSERCVKITNAIKDSQLAYSHCFVSYSPTSFSVQVNGKIIDPTKTEKLTISDNKITVRYDYAFLGGVRKGAKEVVFELDPKATDLSFQFSWDKAKEAHILIDNANPVTITKIY